MHALPHFPTDFGLSRLRFPLVKRRPTPQSPPTGGRVSNNDSLMQSKNFLSSLFDFSFTSFVTLRFIKILYGIFMALAALVALAVFFTFARQGGVGILLALILGPLTFLIWLLVYRVVLEFVVVIFRIAENTSILASRSESDS